MEPIVLFSGITFILALTFFGINYHYPHLKKIKYFVPLSLFIMGCLGWIAVWLGFGWMTTAVVSTALILLAAISFIVALAMDVLFSFKNRGCQEKN
jgi:predicted Kef-type K+ transport protein